MDERFGSETLVHSYGSVVSDFEEGDDALRLAIGPFNAGAGGADVRPVIANTASPFGELGVVGDDFKNVMEVVHDSGEIAGTELRMERARIKEGRRAGSEIELGENIIEFYGPFVFLISF